MVKKIVFRLETTWNKSRIDYKNHRGRLAGWCTNECTRNTITMQRYVIMSVS